MMPSALCTMILYLLLHLVILVESAAAGVTEEEPVSFNEPENGTLYNDEMSKIEDELQNNQTTLLTEDQEEFQEQEMFPVQRCRQDLLEVFSHVTCGADFHTEMMSVSTETWCVLEDIIRPYNNMTICLERLSNNVGCYYPSPGVQNFFLQIHSFYFRNCSRDEDLLPDAPHGLVVALTVLPISLIPVLVYLVVWKSKVWE